MDEKKFLIEKFEANRAHLRAVAYRMLGSTTEVDDAVQETWLRLSRSDTSAVENLNGWLTTVVARVCLDMLRSRKSRREEPMGPHVPEPAADDDHGRDADMADSVGAALLVVLETLAPAERLAFVLHDMFAVPFEEIAPIVGRTPAAAAAGCRARRFPTPIRAASAKSSMPFWPPRATAISRACSPCSIPTSYSAPIRPLSDSARWRKSVVPQQWPKPSRAARRRQSRRGGTAYRRTGN